MTGIEKNFTFWASQVTTRLNDEMKQLSEKTKYNIRAEAPRLARDLTAAGVSKNGAAGKITKEQIKAVVENWKNAGYTVGTMQDKMSSLRSILNAAGNKEAASISNVKLGIREGRDVLNKANIDKSCRIPGASLLEVKDVTVKAAIQLTASYGLRKEEAAKTVYQLSKGHSVEKDGKLVLKGKWCKNGRPREFTMRDGGKALREVARTVLGVEIKGRVEQFRSRIDYAVKQLKAEDKNVHMHGLRHAYAQERYREITGMLAPAAGGLKYAEMTPERQNDYIRAAGIIAHELGHNRETISQTYIGK
jgi:hypothetical protein